MFGIADVSGVRVSDQSGRDNSGRHFERISEALHLVHEHAPDAHDSLLRHVHLIVVGRYKYGARFVPWTKTILLGDAFVDESSSFWVASFLVYHATEAGAGFTDMDGTIQTVIGRRSLIAQIRFLSRVPDCAHMTAALIQRGRERYSNFDRVLAQEKFLG
jgi:hypothetical protein